MLQVIHKAQGAAFITAVLLILAIVALFGIAVYCLNQSLIVVALACWALIVLLPFAIRYVNL